MTLEFAEADILAWFLNERRKEFIKCAQGFDDYSDLEAEYMLEDIRQKVVEEMFRSM
jgi:hypothetical protein